MGNIAVLMMVASPKPVFLIGMPGAGKTYWGEQIAFSLKYQFIDLDQYITAEEKTSIAALFARYGEAGFRNIESRCLHHIIAHAHPDTIIACGGGTPCFNNNLAAIKDAGLVIYLDTTLPHLSAHIAQSAHERPLLSGRADLREYLQQLLAQRAHFYQQAHIILQTSDISLFTFEQIINHHA